MSGLLRVRDLIGYACTSTDEQNRDLELDALKAAKRVPSRWVGIAEAGTYVPLLTARLSR